MKEEEEERTAGGGERVNLKTEKSEARDSTEERRKTEAGEGVDSKEEVVKKKEEELVKKEKMEKTSSRSGLSCLRPNTLDEDTEAFTRCSLHTVFHSWIVLFSFWLIEMDAKQDFMDFDKKSPGVLKEERLHSVLEEGV